MDKSIFKLIEYALEELYICRNDTHQKEHGDSVFRTLRLTNSELDKSLGYLYVKSKKTKIKSKKYNIMKLISLILNELDKRQNELDKKYNSL